MEKLLNKAFNMLKDTVEKRGITVETFSKEFVNNSYFTDGIELHMERGKTLVKMNNSAKRELTEAEYVVMFDLLFGEVNMVKKSIDSEKRNEPLQEVVPTNIALEVESSKIEFGSLIVEEVIENIVEGTNIDNGAAQLALF